MKRGVVIGGIVLAVLLLLVFTVLNKRWWAKRIMMKWDIESNLAANKELLFNTSLARMVQLYRQGMEGWELRGTSGRTQISPEVEGREETSTWIQQ